MQPGNQISVHATDDPEAFAREAGRLLDEQPVLGSVVATNLHSARLDGSRYVGAWWLWAARDGEPVAVAMHTPPRPPYLGSDDSAVGMALADFLAEAGRPVSGVGGFRTAAQAFAGRWSQRHGCDVSTVMDQGVYVASSVTPPSDVPGSIRHALPADGPLVEGWGRAFLRDVGEAERPEGDLLGERIRRGELEVWERDGSPVSMALAAPAFGGISRVGWVYTPPEQRRHGYASAVVAGTTARKLEQGLRCMLYTNLANPTSNAIYSAIGYRRVANAVSLAFR